jgi:hypothetical protein
MEDEFPPGLAYIILGILLLTFSCGGFALMTAARRGWFG